MNFKQNPIETAPKDGSIILVKIKYTYGYEITTAYWDSKYYGGKWVLVVDGSYTEDSSVEPESWAFEIKNTDNIVSVQNFSYLG